MTREYMPMPIDFRLLEMLPEKGMIGGVHWKGRRVIDLVNEMVAAEPELAEHVTSGVAQARLRSMHVYGLVEPFTSFGNASKKIWARTPAGTEMMARKGEVLG